MNIISSLPDDLQYELSKEVYKKNLPKIDNKSFTTAKKRKKMKIKLLQICNYIPFNNISRQNKINKLVKLYLLFESYKYSNNIIENSIFNNSNIFKKVFKNLCNFLSDEDIKSIFCIIIFKSKMTNENKIFVCDQIENSKSFKTYELQLNFYLDIITKLNERKQIFRKEINEIINDIIENNIGKVCKYLFNSL